MKSSVVLSGPMFSGKTTIAELLQRNHGYVLVSARQILRDLAGDALVTRSDLQRFGANIEHLTGGQWIGDAVATIALSARPFPVVLDSARTERQVEAVRAALRGVQHVHLTAPYFVLQRRFETQTKLGLVEPASFAEAMSHPIEVGVRRLGNGADLILDSAGKSPEALLDTLISTLRG